MIKQELLNNLLDKIIAKKRIYSAVLHVENGDGSFSWTKSAGEMQEDSRYFIASVTKLYVTAVVMQLIEKNQLALNNKIAKYLPGEICDRLHVLKGVDYSGVLTIRHLISNTSGLPDYFFHKLPNGKTVSDDLKEGNDQSWHLEKTIGLIKSLKPNFKPGARGKASYSDSNYQLLGRIIETVTGKNIGEVFHDMIFSVLNLQNTYVYDDVNDNNPVPFYYRDKKMWLPEYIASIAVEGGIVSTAAEVMVFLKEFFKGRFFPKERIRELKQWNLILPPPGFFYFGIGLEKLFTPRIFSPFTPVGEILGFWGQTGSFAFHNPERDLFICGTTNQINGEGHMAAGSAMVKIIKSIK